MLAHADDNVLWLLWKHDTLGPDFLPVFQMSGLLPCRRRSFIILSMAVLLALSTLALVGQNAMGTLALAKEGHIWHTGRIC